MLKRTLSVLDPDRFDLGRVAAHERLWLWRHRQPSPRGGRIGRGGGAMRQAEAAAALGLSEGVYRALEQGQEQRISVAAAGRVTAAATGIEPRSGELCFLARRRAGEPLAAAAAAFGVSAPTFLLAEAAGAPALVAFWEGRGFRFPSENRASD